MSKSELQNNFLLNYGWSPTAEEKVHFERFCDGIATQEMLEKVLDPKNHPAFESGRRIRPNIATLYSIKDSAIRALYPEMPPQEEKYTYAPPSCFMCIEGEVWDFVWRDKWVTEYIGMCKFCRDGDAEPSPEVMKIIQSKELELSVILLELSIKMLQFKFNTGNFVPQNYFERLSKMAESR